MDSWLNIMLMCGLLIAFSQGTNASRLPRSKNNDEKNQMLKTNILNLQKHYNTLGEEWVGKSVFAPYLNKLHSKGSCTCQAMLLERMLNIYEEIFTDMKKNELTSAKHILTKVENLRKKYQEENKLWRELQDINLIKVKNDTIQKTALNEFRMVFAQADTENPDNKIP